jgi:2-hydroxychromene-2-carboxylate isomerase
MSQTIDYFFAPQSPWTYLGHARFGRIAAKAGARVAVRPADLGRVFAVSGGLPLAKRPVQRQAYRLVELQRFSAALGIPLNLHPAHFPVAGDPAARLIIAVDLHDGVEAAMGFTARVMAGVWAEERDIAEPRTLAAMLAESGLPARRLEDAQSLDVQERYDANTRDAIELGVFGAPTYVIDGELFWGQDRLDFVERRLARSRA